MKTTKVIATDRKKSLRTGFPETDALASTLILALGTGLLFGVGTAAAEGFRNPPPGTFNLGRAGGRIAQIDDSSAVHQNPANLVELTGPEVQLTPSVVYIGADFHSPSGQEADTKDPWKFLPNLFGALPVTDGKFAFGLGVTAPYGLGSSWNETSSAFNSPASVLRYQSPYFAELKTLNFNPTVAIRLGEHLRLGAGFDVMWSELTFRQFYPWFVFPGSTGTEPDGKIKAQGDGVGYGGNVGLTWLITDRQRFAVSYRSAMNVDYRGDFDISNITPTGAFLGATPRSDFNSQIRFPNIVAAGYGFQVNSAVRLEADVEWIQFSRFQTLPLGAGNNNFLLPATAIPQNWKDTFTVGIGGDWRINEHWIVRASYQFYKSPVPDSTFSPVIPDADQNVFTLGVGWKHNRHSLEAAYGADFYDTRQINNNQNPAFNGEYKITVHLFSCAYRYSF